MTRCLAGSAAVQGLLEVRLAFLGQRGLEHGTAVLAHRVDGLVRGDLLHHEEQRRGSRLQQVADLVLERLVHTGLGDLAHERAHAGADGHPEDRDKEQQAEQQTPEHAPGGPPPTRWWLVCVWNLPSLSRTITAIASGWMIRSWASRRASSAAASAVVSSG